MLRTAKQAHEANNAVIAITKEAAKRHGVHLFVVVGTKAQGGKGSDGEMVLVTGCDAHGEDTLATLQLVAMGYGAAACIDIGMPEGEQAAMLEDAMSIGADNSRLMWSRDKVGLDKQDKPLRCKAPGEGDE